MALKNYTSTTTEQIGLRREFDRLAINGIIGDPSGLPAFAYCRVSSDEQAEKDKSGLPRQIEFVHERASRDGYAITWNRVFADDASGYDLHRPKIDELSKIAEQNPENAVALFIEEPIRLGGEAFIAGYWEREFEEFGLKIVYANSVDDPLVRGVKTLMDAWTRKDNARRMHKGRRDKARRGAIVSQRRTYGYNFAKIDTGKVVTNNIGDCTYVVNDEEAQIVREIFRKYLAGHTIYSISKSLNDRGIPRIKDMLIWQDETIRRMLRNELYVGTYWHNKVKQVVTGRNPDGSKKRKTVENPPEQWQAVDIPAIISKADFEAVKVMFEKNIAMSKRRGKREYLLTGLIRCALCGYSWTGNRGVYHCSTITNGRRRRGVTCLSKSIPAEELDDNVWTEVRILLLAPSGYLLPALRKAYLGGDNADNQKIVDSLKANIKEREAADKRIVEAYKLGAFTPEEFAAQRKMIKQSIETSQKEIDNLAPKLISEEQFAAIEADIMSISAKLFHNADSLSFEEKKRILKLVVKSVNVNPRNWGKLDLATITNGYAIPSWSEGNKSTMTIEYAIPIKDVVSKFDLRPAVEESSQTHSDPYSCL